MIIREIYSDGWLYSHVPTAWPADRIESIERRKLNLMEPDQKHWDSLGQALLNISPEQWREFTRFGMPYQYGRKKA